MSLQLLDHNRISVNTYNCCAELYEKRFMDVTSYTGFLDKFCSYLPLNAKIFDLGCGPGNNSKYLCEIQGYCNIHGIDLSEEMIKRAKVNVPSGFFHVADIRKISFNSSSFEGVLASFCIPYLEYKETADLIKDISMILKPNGHLYLSCMEGSKSGFECTSFSGEMPVYIYYYSKEFLTVHLEDNGFRILDVLQQNYPETDGTFSNDLIIIAQKM